MQSTNHVLIIMAVLAITAYFLLNSAVKDIRKRAEEKDQKECPHCAEKIKKAAKKCRFCNEQV